MASFEQQQAGSWLALSSSGCTTGSPVLPASNSSLGTSEGAGIGRLQGPPYNLNANSPMDDSSTHFLAGDDECTNARRACLMNGSVTNSGSGGGLFSGLVQHQPTNGGSTTLTGAAADFGGYFGGCGSGDIAMALPLLSLSPSAAAGGAMAAADISGGSESGAGAGTAAAGGWPPPLLTPKRSKRRLLQSAGDQSSGDPDTPRSNGSAKARSGSGGAAAAAGGVDNTQRNREAQQRFRQRQRDAVMALESRVMQLDGEAESLQRAKRMVEAHNECLLRQLREAEVAAAAAAERVAAQSAHIAAQAEQIAAQTKQMAALTAVTTTLQAQVQAAQQQVAAQMDVQAAVMREQPYGTQMVVTIKKRG
ncbi:hypothetical protein CHLRE_14g631750v5 [Chlamydomonas reinhardtii]|uniref:BZIP domain-containing protein n=1 Tax=Chlamydomonas reinhardtii TaxID=3055 RepID=A0A2K3CYT4_CHLRE|nr:uncharacterized protein CHLRE_14g631750v5 [Chlamydomonas reinhardtii]PNW73432.1 hypothetical protein CHLRE_14g631750v5 [Chlamydomonas reinhardtii]